MTTTTEPFVSISDWEQLIERIRHARSSWRTYAPFLDSFRTLLADARGLPPRRVPPDVITMNSRFEVRDVKTGEVATHTLVYPEDEAPDDGKLGVLSPMGMALLGTRVREVAHWVGAIGPRAVEVLRLLYQPEAAGDYDR